LLEADAGRIDMPTAPRACSHETSQYDAYTGSHWYVPEPDNPQRADPERSLACRDCHMRLTASGEPAAVRRGAKHRHHGYIAVNQWLPLLHRLSGARSTYG
jgi:hypothetical protein